MRACVCVCVYVGMMYVYMTNYKMDMVQQRGNMRAVMLCVLHHFILHEYCIASRYVFYIRPLPNRQLLMSVPKNGNIRLARGWFWLCRFLASVIIV